MSGKFVTLSEMSFERDMDSPFSPVCLSVMRRCEDDEIMLKLQFVNNSKKKIKEASVSIVCFPPEKTVNYTYTDISAERNEYFGTGDAVSTGLPDIEKLSISIVSAVFEDGSVWPPSESDDTTVRPDTVTQEIVTREIITREIKPPAENGAAQPAAKKSKLSLPVAAAGAVIAVVIILAVIAVGGRKPSNEAPSALLTENTQANTAVSEGTDAYVPETSPVSEENFLIDPENRPGEADSPVEAGLMPGQGIADIDPSGYFTEATTVTEAVRFGYVKEGTGKLNLRRGPTTSSESVIKLKDGERFEIRSEAGEMGAEYTWYFVCYVKDGKEIYGYVRSDYVELE